MKNITHQMYIKCPLCHEHFDQMIHLPIIMTKCGDTFCQKCLLSLSANAIKFNLIQISCSRCQLESEMGLSNERYLDPKYFPTNWLLLELIKGRLSQKPCSHKLKNQSKYICLKCDYFPNDEFCKNCKHDFHGNCDQNFLLNVKKFKQKVEIKNTNEDLTKFRTDVFGEINKKIEKLSRTLKKMTDLTISSLKTDEDKNQVKNLEDFIKKKDMFNFTFCENKIIAESKNRFLFTKWKNDFEILIKEKIWDNFDQFLNHELIICSKYWLVNANQKPQFAKLLFDFIINEQNNMKFSPIIADFKSLENLFTKLFQNYKEVIFETQIIKIKDQQKQFEESKNILFSEIESHFGKVSDNFALLNRVQLNELDAQINNKVETSDIFCYRISEIQKSKIQEILNGNKKITEQICVNSGNDFLISKTLLKLKNEIEIIGKQSFDEKKFNVFSFYCFPKQLEIILKEIDVDSTKKIIIILEQNMQIKIDSNEFEDFRLFSCNDFKKVIDLAKETELKITEIVETRKELLAVKRLIEI